APKKPRMPVAVEAGRPDIAEVFRWIGSETCALRLSASRRRGSREREFGTMVEVTRLAESEATGMQHVLEVCNPVAERYGGEQKSLAPRPTTLVGKTLGLLWNAKPNGDVALKTVGRVAKKLVSDLEV